METLKEKIREIEREEIIHALRESGWVMARAARVLGITERMIGYKIRKYGIRKKEVQWITGETEDGKPKSREDDEEQKILNSDTGRNNEENSF